MSDLRNLTIGSAYLAHEGLESVLETELLRRGVAVAHWHGRLALTESPPVQALWALDVWTAPEMHPIASTGDAARLMRAKQRNWAQYSPDLHRRSALITDRLPPLRNRVHQFPTVPPTGHLGAWTLLAPDLLLLSTTKTSPFINGEVLFEENREDPPSRAYLKLWEALTHLGRWPQPGERTLDLGASPGGWSWVLAVLGAQVTSIDRAPLASNLMAMPNVILRQESAFGLEPEALPPMDWVCSDIIAYPERLLRLTQKWIASGRTKTIVLTIKFQGETDYDTADAFTAIPGGRVLHLWHNKHELTFLWQSPDIVTAP